MSTSTPSLAPTLSPRDFATKWLRNRRTERAASQEHFIDLCHVVGVPTPNDDPSGATYAFDKGAQKTDGSGGFADVWRRDHFAWEYKSRHKNLTGAYQQLLNYREALENPPLLVVSDLRRFEVHTNFTSTKKDVHPFTLEDLRDAPAEPMRILRAVMSDPAVLRPGVTVDYITKEAATRFAELARSIESRAHEPEAVARFLNRLLFCLFAEDVGLLPDGILSRLVRATATAPEVFEERLGELFGLMSGGGGFFGTEHIDWFNGGLFGDDQVIRLTREELATIAEASELDWSYLEPATLGTLFERGLDPDKRGQLGAHYTDRESILRVVEPVLVAPLRREYEQMKIDVEAILARGGNWRRRRTPKTNPEMRMHQFLTRLSKVRVLDPACGSGNFLYVALRALLDLEKEASVWGAARLTITLPLPQVTPEVTLGIEANPYAAELARISVWIGYIQWMRDDGWNYNRNPVLQPLETVECRDAILLRTEGEPARSAR